MIIKQLKIDETEWKLCHWTWIRVYIVKNSLAIVFAYLYIIYVLNKN